MSVLRGHVRALTAAVVLLGSSACSPISPLAPTEPATTIASPPPSSTQSDTGGADDGVTNAAAPAPLEIIEPGKVVPSFLLKSNSGAIFDSADIVGQRPFVLVFFASWCPVCERKMPVVRRALEHAGAGFLSLAVSFDEPETWDDVAPYLTRHGLEMPVVRAETHPRFALSYDPFGAFPLVIVVGSDGLIVDLQMGIGADHEQRLVAALQAADPQ